MGLTALPVFFSAREVGLVEQTEAVLVSDVGLSRWPPAGTRYLPLGRGGALDFQRLKKNP